MTSTSMDCLGIPWYSNCFTLVMVMPRTNDLADGKGERGREREPRETRGVRREREGSDKTQSLLPYPKGGRNATACSTGLGLCSDSVVLCCAAYNRDSKHARTSYWSSGGTAFHSWSLPT